MVELLYDDPKICRILIPIPDNPLRSLNCYVLFTGEKALVIDTGFNRPECQEAMLCGLHELGLTPKDCVLFVTHLHSDHCGLAPKFADAGAEIRMGFFDWVTMSVRNRPEGWAVIKAMFAQHGFPGTELERLENTIQAKVYAPGVSFPAVLMADEEEFTLGSFTFRCVLTPGHTPGHMCLYMPNEKLLFSGDHILYGITPNICPWEGVADPLRDYLTSLDKIGRLEVTRAFPAHREEAGFYQRIQALKSHHMLRLEELLNNVRQSPGETAYQLAQRMTWAIKCDTWVEFPLSQKWFATGETIAHLNYLYNDKKIKYFTHSGLLYSQPTETA